MRHQGVVPRIAGRANWQLRDFLDYRFGDHSALGVALAVSLLVHLAVFFLLGTNGLRPSYSLGITKAVFHVALKSAVTEREITKAPSVLLKGTEEMTGSQQSTSFDPYVSPDALTHRPSLLDNVELFLPEDMRLSGKLTLRLYIGTGGVVEQVEVVESFLPPAYGFIAEQSFVKRRFSPGRIGNRPVPTFTELEIEFNPLE